MTSFQNILTLFRAESVSEKEKGTRFEHLMQLYLRTEPFYASRFKTVWLWDEFPFRKELGGADTGIDLVAQTTHGAYWAIQCKCYQESATIHKAEVDSFLTTAGRSFVDDSGTTTRFEHCLWISTTNKWGSNAEEAIRNHTPAVSRISLYHLQNSSVEWDKLMQGLYGEASLKPKHKPLDHQKEAIAEAIAWYQEQNNDRGKLIMACGTGKTFTSLKIAEQITKGEGLVLFLVPSIALLGQTLEEWLTHAEYPISPVCICSDPEVSKRKSRNEDTDSFSVVDLALPASTDTDVIIRQLKQARADSGITVVFSTYQSIDVVHRVQKGMGEKGLGYGVQGIGEQGLGYGVQGLGEKDLGYGVQGFEEKGMGYGVQGMENAPTPIPYTPNPITPTPIPPTPIPPNPIPQTPIFDLIICDEAHRTTGVTLSNEDESAFVKVHNNNFIRAKKRMYMTATPRLYHDDAKKKAVDNDMVLCSMDDASIYGEEFYHIGFGTAVSKGLLSDYKVLILTVNENDMTASAQRMVAQGETEIPAGDVNKLTGCVNALSKEIVGDNGTVRNSDPEPMCTAVAFCQNIKVSKQITNTFNRMSDLYYKELSGEQQQKMVVVESDHIDGTMAATTRGQKLSWLKSVPKASMQCRILTNVRCLSEGVDVPSLDAVMFLSARNSQVDVVQSVGRVMRRAPGKKYGYIIIPIVVPSDVQGEKALSNNADYAVVWTVLNALRAHDDRFKATINKIELNNNKPESIIIGGASHGRDDNGGTETTGAAGAEAAMQMAIQFDNMQSLLYAKLVDKVGERRYWEQWARDVADIAVRQIANIRKLVENDKKHRHEFEKFLKGLHKNINPSVSEADAIEMLAQHLITQPVFEALFENYSFVRNNPISRSMEQMLALLEEQKDEKDTETLQKFYDSVRERAKDIDNAEAKQKIIVELYDKFFRTAFPMMVERLGIVYTPVEVVDYMIHSVDAVLRREFDRTLGDENLHILDPFTGTGTFITRLLQSGLIRPEDLPRKYAREIHANEIVLLAYYIASVNIENVYHDLMMGFGGQGMGEQGIGYGGQGMEFDEKKIIEDGKNTDIQGTESVAGSDDFGGDGLCGNTALSEGGDVRIDRSDETGGGVCSCEHSSGLRTEEQGGVSEFSVDSQRFTDRVGNSFIDSDKDKLSDCSENGNFAKSARFDRSIADSIAQSPCSITPIPSPTPHNPPYPTPYTPFNGICLTDTFQLGEGKSGEDLFSDMFPQNSRRVQEQQKAPLRVIIGNPPYSIGQKSANDNAQNQNYPKLEKRIEETYAKASDAGLNKSLYDAYIKAFRWASDRLDPQNGGVICFVSNGAWIDGNSTDGFRHCLEKEFSAIYVFNLRGNQRTSGELSRKEGGKIFGSGSRTPIAITILVKKGK